MHIYIVIDKNNLIVYKRTKDNDFFQDLKNLESKHKGAQVQAVNLAKCPTIFPRDY